MSNVSIVENAYEVTVVDNIIEVLTIGIQGPPGVGTNPPWGTITGTLSNQTDLQSELDRIEASAVAMAVALGG